MVTRRFLSAVLVGLTFLVIPDTSMTAVGNVTGVSVGSGGPGGPDIGPTGLERGG